MGSKINFPQILITRESRDGCRNQTGPWTYCVKDGKGVFRSHYLYNSHEGLGHIEGTSDPTPPPATLCFRQQASFSSYTEHTENWVFLLRLSNKAFLLHDDSQTLQETKKGEERGFLRAGTWANLRISRVGRRLFWGSFLGSPINSGSEGDRSIEHMCEPLLDLTPASGLLVGIH